MNTISRTMYIDFNVHAGFSPESVHIRSMARKAAIALGNAPGAALEITSAEVTDDVHAGLVLMADAGIIEKTQNPCGVDLFYWKEAVKNDVC